MPVPSEASEASEAARERLNLVDGLPVAEHAEVYEAVHALLGDALSDIDATPGS
jgi:hypothetical protein